MGCSSSNSLLSLLVGPYYRRYTACEQAEKARLTPTHALDPGSSHESMTSGRAITPRNEKPLHTVNTTYIVLYMTKNSLKD